MSLVTVITITHNRAHFLKEAIESVLQQGYRDYEYLIIDNASDDNTLRIVNEYAIQDKRIRLIKNNSNISIPRSRNQGLREAKGKYIAVLDSDDVWPHPDKLENQVRFLENHPEYAVVGGGVVVIDEKGRELRRYLNPLADDDIRRWILLRNPIAHSSSLMLKDALLKVGGYDEKLKIGEDYELWLRLGKSWRFTNLPDYLIKYRIHQQGVMASGMLRAVKNAKMLIQKYKADYPNYYFGLLIANLRMIWYALMPFR